jgi:hypothetical protein
LQFEASPENSSPNPISKKIYHKERTGGVTQGVGPEFKPQYYKKKGRREGDKEKGRKQASREASSAL